MSSLAVRKSILRTRAVDFSRLLMLSMLEDANDTFSAMLTILSTELGQCNLSVDQFLQIFGDLINELRTKVGRKDEAESASSIIEDFAQATATQVPTSSSARPLLDQIERDPTPHQGSSGLGHSLIPDQVPRFCKNCRRSLSTGFRKPYFKGYCNACYHKSKRLQQHFKEFVPLDQSNCQSATRLKQMGYRQCSDCLKIVAKGGVFYRSAKLCKNCYERHRLMLRRTAQRQCLTCNRTTDKLVDGKCSSCFYESGQRDSETIEKNIHSAINNVDDEDNEDANNVSHWFGSIDNNLNDLNHLGETNAHGDSLFNQCQGCQKTDEELDASGNCQSCQNSILSIKTESTEGLF